jgi:hypothetical protein
MGQFVGQELLAGRAAGTVCSLPEKDVLTGGKGAGVQCTVECVGLCVGVHPHTAEIGAKGRLHLGPYPTVQCLPAAACPLNGRFYGGGDFPIVCFPGHGQDPSHVAVAVAPLQFEQRMLSLFQASFCRLSR